MLIPLVGERVGTPDPTIMGHVCSSYRHTFEKVGNGLIEPSCVITAFQRIVELYW